jgi:hypothetical protein
MFRNGGEEVLFYYAIASILTLPNFFAIQAAAHWKGNTMILACIYNEPKQYERS